MAKRKFTHLEYRNAKVIHLIVKDDVERFIYEKQEISQEEADIITSTHLKNRENRKIKKECIL